jgi:hypothetical protein
MNCDFIQYSSVTEIGCASFCEKWNVPPIAKFTYTGISLVSNSDFFDSGNLTERQFIWSIYSESYLLERFSGKLNQKISQLNNVCSYQSLFLGKANVFLINYLNTKPNIKIRIGDTIDIFLEVIDCDGFKSLPSNLYKFQTYLLKKI